MAKIHFFFFTLFFFFTGSWHLQSEPVTAPGLIDSLLKNSEKHWYSFPDSSIILAREALLLTDTLRDKRHHSKALTSLGTAYYMKGNYSICLHYFFNALQLDEALDEKQSVASDLTNIGNVFMVQGNLEKAYDFFARSLKIKYTLHDRTGTANTLLSIANLYIAQEEYDLALTHARQALSVYDSINDREGRVVIYTTMGNIYTNLNLPDTALNFFNTALQISKETGDIQNEIILCINIGNIHSNREQYLKAIPFFEKAIELAQDIGYLEGLSSAFEKLYLAYESLRQPHLALQYYKLFNFTRDSLQRKENLEAQVKNEMEYNFEKERQRLKSEQEKKDILTKEKEIRNNLILLAVFILFCGALVIVFLMFRSYKAKQRANKLLEEKNKIIQQQNKDITDSIEYALRIQRAMLTSEYFFQKYNLDYFNVYIPKNIVSGDFYYMVPLPDAKNPDHPSSFIVVTADATGHGVPGAFMSLIGIILLDEIIVQRKITQPDIILNQLRAEIINILNPEGHTELTHDGMDMTVCRYDFQKMQLDFASAYNPLYLIRNGEVSKYPADRMPIGLYHGIAKPFRNQSIPLKKGDIIYTSTDGFPDQHGGPEGKKYKSNVMKELFCSIHSLSMSEQKKKIKDAFYNWKSGAEQTDDICVIGIRI